ncbi:MAG: hypothetical protein L0154_01485 [Chloroflexi bacterium]|nr:hypothetical protein [Chloroflexota bacterium]
MKKLLLLGLLLIFAAACEPLAPSQQQQAIIIVTNTPTSEFPPTATPNFVTSLPQRPTPTNTIAPVVLPSPTIEPCDEPNGRIISNVFFSTLEGAEVPYRVYVPPCFFQTLRRYPYVILLHGSGYTFEQWTDDLNLQEVMDEMITGPANPLPPMVVVMPEGGTLMQNNFFEIGRSFEDLILSELIPELERQFCVWETADGRAIGGISRGGFWAFSIAFRNPDEFSAVGGHSPAFYEGNAPITHNPLALADTITPQLLLRIYLDNAREDIGGDSVLQLSNILRENGVPHTYDVSPTGGHDNDYWGEHLPDYLAFYGKEWSPNPATYPSCFE